MHSIFSKNLFELACLQFFYYKAYFLFNISHIAITFFQNRYYIE
jgi:hypothetical protein